MPRDIQVTGSGLKRQNQNKKTEGKKVYTVGDGQSYFSIAQDQLGTDATPGQVAAYARALADANNNMSLRSGQSIRIPRVNVSANARLFTSDGTLGTTAPSAASPAPGLNAPGFGATIPTNAPPVAPGYGGQIGLSPTGLNAYQNSERTRSILGGATAGVIGQGVDPGQQVRTNGMLSNYQASQRTIGGVPGVPQVTLFAPDVNKAPGSPDKPTFANPTAGYTPPTVKAGTTANTNTRNAEEDAARTGNLYLNNLSAMQLSPSYDINVLDTIGVDISLLLNAGYQADLNTGRLVISPEDLTALNAAASNGVSQQTATGILMDNSTFFNSRYTGITPLKGRGGSGNNVQYSNPNSGGYADYGSAVYGVVNWRVSFG